MARRIPPRENKTVCQRGKRQTTKQSRAWKNSEGTAASKRQRKTDGGSHHKAILASLCKALTAETDLHLLLGRILQAVVEELNAPAGQLLIEGVGQEKTLQLDYRLGQPQAKVHWVPTEKKQGIPPAVKPTTTDFFSDPTVVGAGKARFVFVPLTSD